ncbi:FAD-dependent oxidoreductase [Aquihabitans daechungensis]|uniref:FAD-dependent oxidoreductase n=1 Tax=Aquihabitans daechungensis TaxID=1052257 RepID=UPI003BA1413E
MGGSLAAAGAGLLASCSSDAADRSTTTTTEAPSREQRRKVIVIGTGFGGSVTALRLARRGVDVTLIERGQRWASGKQGTFPTMTKPDQRVSWLSETNTAAGNLFPSDPWEPYTGLMERIKGDGMDVVCGAAVGGGSLPYHGMSVQPRGDLFSQVMPGELDYDEFDERWYPFVRNALSASPIPDDVLASDQYAMSRRFQEYVRAAGLPDAHGVPMPIDWDVVRREIRGELPPVISTGDVIYGVNGPGKHSLDTNYIPAAEATGHVDLLPLHRVERIRRTGSGAWEVSVDKLDTTGDVLEHLTMTADALFLCAGSPNTTKLLVRAAGNGDIPDLPEDVGRWWSTNGDLLTTQFLAEPTGAVQGGPRASGRSTGTTRPARSRSCSHRFRSAPRPTGWRPSASSSPTATASSATTPIAIRSTSRSRPAPTGRPWTRPVGASPSSARPPAPPTRWT